MLTDAAYSSGSTSSSLSAEILCARAFGGNFFAVVSLAKLGLPFERAGSLEEGVSRARELAQRGDLVLLAPACSSFDMFKSYAHRGDVFQEAVRALTAEEGAWA